EFTNVPKPQISKHRNGGNIHHEVFGAVLSPDGRILATRSGPMGNLYLLETATGKLLHEFKRETDIASDIKFSVNFAFSPDGKMLAALLGGRLELREVATGRMLWKQIETYIVDLAFSPEGKILASGSGNGGGVRLWDARTGELLRALGPKENVNRIAFSPDGRTLAVGHEPTKERMCRIVQLWDVATGKEVRQLGESDKQIAFPVFSPDGKIVATCSGRGICLWETATGKELRRCQNTTPYYGDHPVAFSPDGKLLAALDGPLVRFWDVASGEALPSQ